MPRPAVDEIAPSAAGSIPRTAPAWESEVLQRFAPAGNLVTDLGTNPTFEGFDGERGFTMSSQVSDHMLSQVSDIEHAMMSQYPRFEQALSKDQYAGNGSKVGYAGLGAGSTDAKAVTLAVTQSVMQVVEQSLKQRLHSMNQVMMGFEERMAKLESQMLQTVQKVQKGQDAPSLTQRLTLPSTTDERVQGFELRLVQVESRMQILLKENFAMVGGWTSMQEKLSARETEEKPLQEQLLTLRKHEQELATLNASVTKLQNEMPVFALKTGLMAVRAVDMTAEDRRTAVQAMESKQGSQPERSQLVHQAAASPSSPVPKLPIGATP